MNAIQEAIIDEVHEQMIADHGVLMSWPGARFNQGTSDFNISQTPPLVPELFYEEIYSNRHIMAILQNIMGPRPQLGLLTSNFALPSGPRDRQAVHTDAYANFLTFPYAMEVFFYTRSVDSENASTEFWPGTHIYTMREIHDTGRGWVKKCSMDARAAVCPPFQPRVPKGSICARSLQLWHAGMPNHSNAPRIMVGLLYFPAWYQSQMKVILPDTIRPKVQNWLADLTTLTIWVEGKVEYVKNQGTMNAQVPLNFCQRAEDSLLAVRTRLDRRDGRSEDVMPLVTEDNYWVAPQKTTQSPIEVEADCEI